MVRKLNSSLPNHGQEEKDDDLPDRSTVPCRQARGQSRLRVQAVHLQELRLLRPLSLVAVCVNRTAAITG